MKTLASITLLSLALSTQAFATCRLPNGQTNDGTLGAAEMLLECGPNGQDPSEAIAAVAKYEAAPAAPAAPTLAPTTTIQSLVKVAH